MAAEAPLPNDIVVPFEADRLIDESRRSLVQQIEKTRARIPKALVVECTSPSSSIVDADGIRQHRSGDLANRRNLRGCEIDGSRLRRLDESRLRLGVESIDRRSSSGTCGQATGRVAGSRAFQQANTTSPCPAGWPKRQKASREVTRLPERMSL